MRRSDKHKKKIQLLMGAIIVFVMVFSVFGFIIGYSQDSGRTIKYNDLVFKATQQGFRTKIDGKSYLFSNFPADLENINISPVVVSKIKNTKMVHLTSDPKSALSSDIALVQYNFQRELNDYVGIYASFALTKNSTYNLPIITCQNATEFVPVIGFKEGESTQISLEGDCIIFESDGFNGFTRLKDRVLFIMLGVMD